MSEKRETLLEKKCEQCGHIFKPILAGQNKCITCIMKNEPPEKPENANNSKVEPAWVEWFIYNWRCIRIAAQEMNNRGQR